MRGRGEEERMKSEVRSGGEEKKETDEEEKRRGGWNDRRV